MNLPKIAFEDPRAFNANHITRNAIRRAIDATYSRRSTDRDKSDRATIAEVFDAQTLAALRKLIARGALAPLQHSLSTGKEACVFVAPGAKGAVAVKIFKTMLTRFRRRADYVEGDFRFQSAANFNRANPRKFIAVWALKEFRNLHRLRAAGIPAPEPFELKHNVLVMQLVGDGGKAAPRLRDAALGADALSDAYARLTLLVRDMFIKCQLVHGDLSEYNILWHANAPVVIDVSQAIEHNHPYAIPFLKRDLANLNAFFEKQGVCVLPLDRLFDIVTDALLDGAALANALRRARAEAAEIGAAERGVRDERFMQVNVPRTLHEIDAEDVERLLRGAEFNPETQLYSALTGLKRHSAPIEPFPLNDLFETEIAVESEVRPKTEIARESREEKQKRQKEVKESNRIRRANRTPKKERKKAEKRSKF